MGRNEQIKISDVMENAVGIGKDLGEMNGLYGPQTTEEIIPKLVFLLGRLETMVCRHSENEGLKKSLAAECQQLRKQKRKTEEATMKSEKKLKEIKDNQKQCDRHLKTEANILFGENRSYAKDLKKKKKKIEKRKNGCEQNFVLWFLDKAFFHNRIHFITKEFPRDLTNVGKLRDLIDVQDKEIFQLTREINLQEKKSKQQKEKETTLLSVAGSSSEREICTLEERLRSISIKRKIPVTNDIDVAEKIKGTPENVSPGDENSAEDYKFLSIGRGIFPQEDLTLDNMLMERNIEEIASRIHTCENYVDDYQGNEMSFVNPPLINVIETTNEFYWSNQLDEIDYLCYSNHDPSHCICYINNDDDKVTPQEDQKICGGASQLHGTNLHFRAERNEQLRQISDGESGMRFHHWDEIGSDTSYENIQSGSDNEEVLNSHTLIDKEERIKITSGNTHFCSKQTER